ncbi:MAG: hypothetical protein UV58_C0002G0008 [Candidatus Wolfebacteria bacterium GW2011_GWC1_43_10]|uniref:Uncharacterized protein n=1 Tax=Candidatus Wolfebacteria bacterium GW2011_GWC1_43_10 TaxID=1619011 RepID=A0A0G1F831_9BACT|nr:MAG: hypothetical protein UV58_C0002G0008 [Candidatus Wolfebacteria bacterium GW2011_GWC1_43_10]KKT23055.1 MAG: hypothetical protein UW08_C0001G0018 [Parcubacteria group bacterium GW2011_GWB1_43_8b]
MKRIITTAFEAVIGGSNPSGRTRKEKSSGFGSPPLCDIIGGMKPKSTFRKEAEELRRKGLSYNEIRKKIGVSKSSLSLWLKSIPLKEEDRKRLYTKRIVALSLGPHSQKQRREVEIKEIIKNAGKEIEFPLSLEVARLMGAALYWAEGSKGNRFEMTNSDPHLILYFINWVKLMFGISPKNLRARLNIYPQQDNVKIKQFWSSLTGIPIKSFGKSYVKPLSKNYKKNNLYYGTIRIEVPKSSNIKHRVFGWIEAVLKNINSDVELSQKRWRSLRETPRPVNIKVTPHNLTVK